jgi:hypothetical protein
MIQLSDYISLAEFTLSRTAIINGIDNSLPKELEENANTCVKKSSTKLGISSVAH